MENQNLMLPVEVEQLAQNVTAEKKAANAPCKTKLIELALQIDALNLPEIKSEEAKKILVDVKTLLAKVSTFIRDKSTSI